MPHYGIGITTRNRWDEVEKTLAALDEYGPTGVVVVVDDGSEEARDLPNIPNGVRLVRNDVSQGIPAAKNRCIEELYQAGCTDMFLFDDDTRPASPMWWTRYVDSPEPHLQYSWTHFAPDNRPVPKMDVLYRDRYITAYGWSMGCMLYVTREVIDRVGGMDPRFGQGMEEHAEWSQRIHNAGFTSFVHQDVTGAVGEIYAADEHYAVKRSLPPGDRTQLLRANTALRESLADSNRYVEFRRTEDLVLTSYFTALEDEQRSRTWPADIKPVKALIDSVESHGHRVYLITDIGPLNRPYWPAEQRLSAYQQRWLSQWQFLRANPQIRRVWLVDALDVEMLNDPFPHMEDGVLYCGWEPQSVDCDWIAKHVTPTTKGWVSENKHRQLLNCGVVGGSREDVMRLCRRMNDLAAQDHYRYPLAEMVYFNIAANEHPHVASGRPVTTLFKGYERDGDSWWRHK